MRMEKQCHDSDEGKVKYLKQNLSYSVIVCTASSIWTSLGSNSGIEGERPATSRLSQGASIRLKLSNRSRKTLVPNLTNFATWFKIHYGDTSLAT